MINNISNLLDKLTTYLLTILIFLMISLSLAAIIARYSSITLLWIDPLLRHFVFLATFLGASLAIGSNKHIKIDVLPRVIELKCSARTQKIYEVLGLLITLIIIFYLYKAGHEFFLSEKEYGTESFLDLHSSTLTSIIPYGFLLLMIRNILKIISTILRPNT